MKKFLFLSLLIAILVITPLFAFSQEIVYPSIPGVAAPQEFLKDVQSQEEILPLFMTYFFHLFLVVSIAVALSVMLYGGFIYIISSGDPEKRRQGKSWILSAAHGALIVFASYSLLFTLDSQLVLFQQRGIDKTGTEGKVDLKWEIKNVYYQIPFGLLIEDAILNETAQNKLYDVLNATYKAEDTSNAIEQGSKQLLEIIEKCPDKEPCCGDGGNINSPPIKKTESEEKKSNKPSWMTELDKSFENKIFPDWLNTTPPSSDPQKTEKIVISTNDASAVSPYKVTDEQKKEVAKTIEELEEQLENKDTKIAEKDREKIKEIIEELNNLISNKNISSAEFIEKSRNLREELEKIYDSFAEKNPVRITAWQDFNALEKLINTLPKESRGNSEVTSDYSHLKDIPYIYQKDPEWSKDSYAGGTIGGSACIPATASMPIAYFTGQDVEVVFKDLISLSNDEKLHLRTGLFSRGAEKYGIGYELKKINNQNDFTKTIQDATEKGDLVSLTGKGVPYNSQGSTSGHALLIVGTTTINGQLHAIVHDPNDPFKNTVPIGDLYKNKNSNDLHIFSENKSLNINHNLFFSGLLSLSFFNKTTLLSLSSQIYFYSFTLFSLIIFLFVFLGIKRFEKITSFKEIGKKNLTGFISLVLIFSLVLSSLPINYLQRSHFVTQKENVEVQNETKFSPIYLNPNIVFAENKDGNSYWQHVWKETKEGAVLGGASGSAVGAIGIAYLGGAAGALAGGFGAIPGALLGSALGAIGGAVLGGAAGALVRGVWALFTYKEVEEEVEKEEEEEEVEEKEEVENTFTENCKFYKDSCPDNCSLGSDATDCGGNTPSLSHLCCCCEEELNECPDNSSLQTDPCEEGQEEVLKIKNDTTGETIYCCEEELNECPDNSSLQTDPCGEGQKQVEEITNDTTGETIYCCEEELNCSQFGEGYVDIGEATCSEGQAKHGCKEITDEGGSAITCCCPEEPFCLEDGCDVAEECPEGTVETGELDGMLCCCEEEEKEECPECPDIAPAVQAKIAEIEGYMAQLAKDLDALLLTKEPIKEDLYQLYKVVMLKSLGYKQVFGYNSLLLEKRYYERGEVVIDTDREVSKIGKYTWDWSRWINNILYRIELGGRVIEENDSATFYLRMPESKKIIDDALRLAKEAKANDIQKIGKDIGVKKPQSQNIFQKVFSFVTGIFSGPGKKEILAQADQKKLQEYLDENNIDPAKISATEFNEIVNKLGINTDQSQTLSVLQRLSPSEFLECNMEIPVGEVFELTWAHLIELLDTIDEYVEEGKKLIEQQAKMNELARPCDCPCEGDEECPDACGACKLTCDLATIKAAHQDVLKTREKMKEIAAHIELLTDGHFNTPTENLCEPLNEDVRDDAEKLLCAGGGKKLISKHELITRKLNYSRSRFDGCITRPEQLEDVLEGNIAGKLPFFGPLLEEKGIPRYTKTVVSGSRVNTSDFNWFCCSDSKLENK